MKAFTAVPFRRLLALALLVAPLAPAAAPARARAQERRAAFTMEDVLSPAFPYNLVAARKADRIAWIENQQGMRNVYTAAVDSHLNERKFIVPGLGDFGDRLYGTC